MEFYVYAYLREDGSPYYIGKGKGRRIFSKNRKCPVPKDKSRITLLLDKLSEKEAFEWETFFIRAYGRIDNGTGILRNLTDGGEGMSGCSPYNKGVPELNGMYGKKHKEETKKLIGEIHSKYKYEIENIETGEFFVITSIRPFCRERGLSRTGLRNTLSGKSRQGKTYTQHKGYRIISRKEMVR